MSNGTTDKPVGRCTMTKTLPLVALCVFCAASQATAQETLIAAKIDTPPVVDGHGGDPAWNAAVPITVRDAVAPIEVQLKAVYTSDEIFLLATFPDATESRAHKTLVWDDGVGAYQVGPHREDTFVFKWSLEPDLDDLSLSANRPYRADLWYWKANRTDHAGNADDKIQNYSITELPRSTRVLSKNGRTFYLLRSGDDGDAAYRALIYREKTTPQVPMYAYQTPRGSRADVRAKGEWQDGRWTIEFSRKLWTGNRDDVQLEPGIAYLFGASRFEIAGRPSDPDLDEPAFGSGDVAQPIFLEFAR